MNSEQRNIAAKNFQRSKDLDAVLEQKLENIKKQTKELN